jgi:hypothetical protein
MHALNRPFPFSKASHLTQKCWLVGLNFNLKFNPTITDVTSKWKKVGRNIVFVIAELRVSNITEVGGQNQPSQTIS